MKFVERIKQLREERQLPQRKLATILDIDTATYCKIENGERRVKAELLALWLADQVSAVVENEQSVADKALKITKEKIKN
jgi:transcriptional regulator with XRE-family HTH domain